MPNPYNKHSMAIALSAAVLALAACGGSNDEPAPAGTTTAGTTAGTTTAGATTAGATTAGATTAGTTTAGTTAGTTTAGTTDGATTAGTTTAGTTDGATTAGTTTAGTTTSGTTTSGTTTSGTTTSGTTTSGTTTSGTTTAGAGTIALMDDYPSRLATCTTTGGTPAPFQATIGYSGRTFSFAGNNGNGPTSLAWPGTGTTIPGGNDANGQASATYTSQTSDDQHNVSMSVDASSILRIVYSPSVAGSNPTTCE